MVHVKKCWPDEFRAIRNGSKPFEWRKEDDCKYEVDDVMVLLEWQPTEEIDYAMDGWPRKQVGYTGEVEKRRVTYVLRDEFGVPPGYAVLGLGWAKP